MVFTFMSLFFYSYIHTNIFNDIYGPWFKYFAVYTILSCKYKYTHGFLKECLNIIPFVLIFHSIKFLLPGHIQRFPPVVPIRNDSLSLYEQNELKGASWFQAGLPREISLEVLSRQQVGSFLVRQSTTKPGCFALSLRVPPPAPKVAHYLILRTIRGYKIKVSCNLF